MSADKEMIRQFVTPFFTTTETHRLIEFRCLWRGEDPRRVVSRFFPQSPSQIDRVSAFAEAHADGGYDVYISPNPKVTMLRGVRWIAALEWLGLDIDVGSLGHASTAHYEEVNEVFEVIREHEEQHQIAPSIVTTTGGGVHAFYRLAQPTDLVTWKAAMSELIYSLRADRNAAQPNGLLRVGGTLNHKRDQARPVVLRHLSDAVTPIHKIMSLPHAHVAKPPHLRIVGSTVRREVERPRPPGERPFDRANDIPVAEVLVWLGCELHREGTRVYCVCPICGGTNRRKMAVGGGRSNIATCFADCGAVYTVVDVVSRVRKCSPRAAVNLVAKQFNFDGFAL